MFNTILVCSDGSRSALHGAFLAAQIARNFHARLLLLHVFDEDAAIKPFFNLWEQNLGREALTRYMEQTQADVEGRTRKVFNEAGVDCRTVRENGHPVESIVAVAASEAADLIVMGSRGLSEWKALLLGSVSHGVLYHAPCSVLIARGEETSFHQLLLASDGSESARNATREAVTLAKAFATPLNVLNVCEGLPDFGAISRESIEDMENSVQVREALASCATAGAALRSLDFTVREEIGRPAAVILKFAGERESDLIVMGSHGLDAASAFLLGSVSDRVVHHASCSVLVAR